LGYLRGLGLVPEPLAPGSPAEAVVAAYGEYLVRERGLVEGRSCCVRGSRGLFLGELSDPIEAALAQLRPGDVTRLWWRGAVMVVADGVGVDAGEWAAVVAGVLARHGEGPGSAGGGGPERRELAAELAAARLGSRSRRADPHELRPTCRRRST